MVAFALRIVTEFGVTPLTYALRSAEWSVAISTASAVTAVLIPWGGYWLCTRPAWHRAAEWGVDTDRRRFVADLTPRWAGPQCVFIGWFSGSLVPHERVPGMDQVRIADLGIVTDVFTVCAVVGLILGAVVIVAGYPRLTLDPGGVAVHRLMGWRRQFGWDELVPGGPPPPTGRNPRVVTVYRRPPPESPHTFRPWHLRADRLHVDPAFLAHTLRRYLDHPEHRPAIGTEEELAALRAAFTPSPVG
ncbi:hypothetical protein KRMM14A1004_13780 [Krasilnikovia sp. MM14-A1004]